MSGFSLKGGWHPKGKGGGKESWRGDFKGINQIANKFGKGRDPDAEGEQEQHVSRPLTSLRDPSSFGPPPKHVGYAGDAASPRPTQAAGGLGASLRLDEIEAQQHYQQRMAEQEQEEEEEKPPPGPYKRDTTGLSTSHLPPPPVRRVDGASPPPPPRSARASPAPPPRAAVAAPPSAGPRLPPRLPPRQNSRPDLDTPPPPPSYNEAAAVPEPDYAAMGRLGQAGVSVPGLDIGRDESYSAPASAHGIQDRHPTPPGAPQAMRVNELQERFAKMNFPSTHGQPTETQHVEQPSQGTSWQQKQAAADTAAKFHKDPSSVSFSDARGAASTANNFRQRHGDQVKSGWAQAREMGSKYGAQAKEMNTKYGITDKAKDAGSRASQSAQNVNTKYSITERAGSSKYGQQASQMNDKYGITNRAKGYADTAKDKAASYRSAPSAPSPSAAAGPDSPHPPAFSRASSSPSSILPAPSLPGAKKAPPPPPPPKKRELGGGAAPAPPPVPLSSKPR
ncbi:hypothetical protein AAFC00_003051 [Neodothiora populina]|uniref:Uncharacterized protein n=1 Tax=Neodothiora populina TaxID=2781224 RepID=A0ABR3P941_9PEZI